MKLFLGADHRGFALKEDVKIFLEAKGYEVVDVGAHVYDAQDDYPECAYVVAKNVSGEKGARGILICGSGEGVTIVANKVRGIRASACYTVNLAHSGRADDDINVLSLSADLTDEDTARAIALAFLETNFSGEERHERRLQKIVDIENGDVFDQWNVQKKHIHIEERRKFFREGDVCFVRVGKNIGFEQDGKGVDFLRPVLIVRKFNQDVFFGVMLTTKYKKHPLYCSIGVLRGVENYAILSQGRLIDAKRLDYKIGHVDKGILTSVREGLGRALRIL